MPRVILIGILMISLSSCGENKDFSKDFANHHFDIDVINRLSLYDTLRQTLIQNIGDFKLNENKQSFEYFYNFDTAKSSISRYSNGDMPNSLYPVTTQLFQKIGEGKIYGFRISRDSTLEIFLRNTHKPKYFLDIRERLNWYSSGDKIKEVSFPAKDTILPNNWQYEIWFDKRAEL